MDFGFTKEQELLKKTVGDFAELEIAPKAPIFDMADIGIVADLREALPHLIEEFRGQKG